VSAFPELNVRTYVVHGDKPGVYFFSLDATSALAVRAARMGFHLPYYDAEMSCEPAEDGWIEYRSTRTHSGAPPGVFRGRYRPTGEPYEAEVGGLENWLTERYCLYAVDENRPRRGEIHHARWPLRKAEAEIETCTVTEGWGIHLPEQAPLLHFVDRIDVVAWMLEQPD
jgi:uncharacterized protein YqjF (DUF2071 family)